MPNETICAVCKKPPGVCQPKEQAQKKARIYFGLSDSQSICATCFNKWIDAKRLHKSKPLLGIEPLGIIKAEAEGALLTGKYDKFAAALDKVDRKIGEIDDRISPLLDQIQELTLVRNNIMSVRTGLNNLIEGHPASNYIRRRREANAFISKPAVRYKVFARDGMKCVHCKRTEHLSVDHKISVWDGGSNELSNLQTLCSPCNSRKGATSQKPLPVFA